MNEALRQAEYQILNQEISDNSKRIDFVLNVCITATSAFLAFSFTVDTAKLPLGPKLLPFVCLLPFSVIFPSIILIDSSLNSTARIASYLRIVHETGGAIQWQRTIQAFRSNPKSRRFVSGLVSVFAILSAISILGSIATLFLASQGGNIIERSAFVPLYGSIVVFLLFVLALMLRRLVARWSQASLGDIDEDMKEALQRVRTTMNPQGSG